MQSTKDIIDLAIQYSSDAVFIGSAMLRLKDAKDNYKKRDFYSARKSALDVLAYSLGIFHPIYIEAKNLHEKLTKKDERQKITFPYYQ